MLPSGRALSTDVVDHPVYPEVDRWCSSRNDASTLDPGSIAAAIVRCCRCCALSLNQSAHCYINHRPACGVALRVMLILTRERVFY